MTRRPSRVRGPSMPLPRHITETFYTLCWDLVSDPVYVLDAHGISVRPRHTTRRHALVALWMTACALRFSEMRRLSTADVSKAGRYVYVTRSKGGLSGNVPLAKVLISQTFRWREEKTDTLLSPWLLPSRTGNQLSNNAFNRDAGKLFEVLVGIQITSHCFRCTAAQLAMAQEAKARETQRLLGHKSQATTELYCQKLLTEAFQLGLFEQVHHETR